MGRWLRALLIAVLITEIAAVFLGSSVWAVLAGLHASLPVLIGFELIAGAGVALVFVLVFQRALACENRIGNGPAPQE